MKKGDSFFGPQCMYICKNRFSKLPGFVVWLTWALVMCVYGYLILVMLLCEMCNKYSVVDY